MTDAALIDNFSTPPDPAAETQHWELITDGVMGGLSEGTMRREIVDGRPALRMRGAVRLENNGGFVQIARNLGAGGPTKGGAGRVGLDARDWTGIALDVLGNGAQYNVHLRTADTGRPWQSYRQSFTAPSVWTTVTLPFDEFAPHRVDAPLDLSTLRRIGIVAIGRAFAADLAIARVAFYE